jgi:hypothetical protein
MKGSIAITRSLQKNSKGHYDFESAFLKVGAIDAFNQVLSVALADYPKIREVVQEMEVIYQLNFYELNSNDFNTAVKELECFFKNLQSPTELQELARRVWQESVVALVRKDPRYQPS